MIHETSNELVTVLDRKHGKRQQQQQQQWRQRTTQSGWVQDNDHITKLPFYTVLQAAAIFDIVAIVADIILTRWNWKWRHVVFIPCRKKEQLNISPCATHKRMNAFNLAWREATWFWVTLYNMRIGSLNSSTSPWKYQISCPLAKPRFPMNNISTNLWHSLKVHMIITTLIPKCGFVVLRDHGPVSQAASHNFVWKYISITFWPIGNLRIANLRIAILKIANLRIANLRIANLRIAILRIANLRIANLRIAILRIANLRIANLRIAILRIANLRIANLRIANLRIASLRIANIRTAILRIANLRIAILRIANLRIANLRMAIGRNVVLIYF